MCRRGKIAHIESATICGSNRRQNLLLCVGRVVSRASRLTGTTGVDLAEQDLLELVVHRQDTGKCNIVSQGPQCSNTGSSPCTSNTTEDVCASTLEERLDTLGLDDLSTGINHVCGEGISNDLGI